ncbi:MAG: flagellar motor protein MotA, partial [Hyphomicrobiales bacterium]
MKFRKPLVAGFTAAALLMSSMSAFAQEAAPAPEAPAAEAPATDAAAAPAAG